MKIVVPLVFCALLLMSLLVIIVSSSTNSFVDASKNNDNAVVKLVVHGTEFGPVPESTCTTFLNAFWCPTSLMCVVAVNSSAAALDHCNELCDATCTDFTNCQTCASDERNCGDCMFAGGVWSATKGKCFPDDRLCDQHNDTCIEDDRLCPVCDRYNRPVTCLPLFPLAVAVLSGALLFAILGSVWILLHWYAPVTEEEVNAQTRLPTSEQPKQTGHSARISHRAVPVGEVVAVQGENGETQYVVRGNSMYIPPSSSSPNASARLVPAGAIVGKLPPGSGRESVNLHNGGGAAAGRWSAVKTAVILTRHGTRLSASPAHSTRGGQHSDSSPNNSGIPTPAAPASPNSSKQQQPIPMVKPLQTSKQQQHHARHADDDGDDAVQGQSLASNRSLNAIASGKEGRRVSRLDSNELGNGAKNLSGNSSNQHNNSPNLSSSKHKKPKRRESNTLGNADQQDGQ